MVRLRSAPARSGNETPDGTDEADGSGGLSLGMQHGAEVHESRIVRLRARMLALGEVLDAKGAMSNADYRELFGTDRRKALADLSTLVDLGWLARRGERRGTRYVRPD